MNAATTFHDLFVAHAPAVRRVAQALSGDRDLADDLTAETFVRALASRTPIRGDSARAWLFAIARHLWISQRRRPGTARVDDDALLDTLESADADPELHALRQQRVERVHAAMLRLRDDERALLQLALIDGLDIPELAEALGIGRDHTRVRLHRARRRLLQQLAPEAP